MTGNSSDNSTLPTPENAQPSSGARLRNFLIAIAAILLSTSIFIGLKTETAPGLLSAMAEEAVPLEIALSNGKPTFLEFYANWCTSCQSMAPDLEALKQQHGDQINFVMLNVDNSKWLPEILQYRVDGIPHFVFLNNQGAAIAQAIGEQPRSIMDANLVALTDGTPLPHAQATGQTSAFSAAVTPNKASTTDPKSHSTQVAN